MKKKMPLVILTLLTIILLTEAAEIKRSTVEPGASEVYVTVERGYHHKEDKPAAAAEEREEMHDAGVSHEEEHDDTESDHHEQEHDDKKSVHHEQEHDDQKSGHHEEEHDDQKSGHHEEEHNDQKSGHHEEEHAESDHKEEHGHHWNYHEDSGPKSWSSINKDCAGRYQSPINIDTESTKLNELLTEISLIVHNVTGDRITVINNGHTVSLAFDRTTMRLDGGDYDHTYRVAGVHFHWGSDDLQGSEHMIGGKHFPLEMHIVSYDEDDFNSVSEATSSRDGIAVLGILFTVSNDPNINLDPLISHLKDVRDPDDLVSLEYFDLKKLLPLNRKNYFRYSGSLTTPPCSESVLWTVFATPQTISSAQLAEFRTLHQTVRSNGTGDPLLYNWRPVQPMLTRVVHRSFPTTIIATAVSRLSPDAAQHSRINDHQSYNTAPSVVWNKYCQRNIFIGWIIFYLIATML